MRQYFCLASGTPFIISCIAPDDEVEMIRDGLKFGNLAREFALLKPAGIIVPNYSFVVDDVPRTHTIYNRKRICIAARLLSDAGCPVILPILALNKHDWDFWSQIIAANPDMVYVAKEFQTGLKARKMSSIAIDGLADLQNQIGRRLHPIAVSGFTHRNQLGARFSGFSILESRAFMLATKRRRAYLSSNSIYSEVDARTQPGETIDALLARNITARRKRTLGNQ